MRILWVGLPLAAILSVLSGAVHANPYFTGLGDLPGGTVYSRADAISGDGSTVVGYSQSAAGQEAFRWTLQEGMVGIGDLPGEVVQSRAWGVSADGSAIVGEGWSWSGTQAFRWTPADGMVGLGDLRNEPFRSRAYAISGDGSIVVGAGKGPYGSEGFRWTSESGMEGLGSLPNSIFRSTAYGIAADGLTIVGNSAASGTSSSGEAFRWTDDRGMLSIGDLPGATKQSSASGVSADGSVIVGTGTGLGSTICCNSVFLKEAFRWTQETGLVALGDLQGGNFHSEATAVSADGSRIVGYGLSGAGQEAFIWDEPEGMRELDVVLAALGLDLSGWTLTSAEGLSADGRTIVGFGTNPSGKTEAWIAMIPEPSTGLLLTAGLLGLSFRQSRIA